MGRRLLVIPHVGTAFGHLIRVGEILQSISANWDEIAVSIPSHAISYASRHIPQHIKLFLHESNFAVTNPDGGLKAEQFIELLNTNRRLAKDFRPDLIIGDPGIIAGIIGEEIGVPWGTVTHSPYLPFPTILEGTPHEKLAKSTWNVVTRALDELVIAGSRNRFLCWEELRKKSLDEIFLAPAGYFSRNSILITGDGIEYNRVGWVKGRPFSCLVTTSSGCNQPLPRRITDYLAKRYDEVGVIGPIRPSLNPKVTYLGIDFDLRSLVSQDTAVVTHGGIGTLQCLSSARSVTIVPGDLDQLCNGLIAEAQGLGKIVGHKIWEDRLNSGSPFIRQVPWDEYLESDIDTLP